MNIDEIELTETAQACGPEIRILGMTRAQAGIAANLVRKAHIVHDNDLAELEAVFRQAACKADTQDLPPAGHSYGSEIIAKLRDELDQKDTVREARDVLAEMGVWDPVAVEFHRDHRWGPVMRETFQVAEGVFVSLFLQDSPETVGDPGYFGLEAPVAIRSELARVYRLASES